MTNNDRFLYFDRFYDSLSEMHSVATLDSKISEDTGASPNLLLSSDDLKKTHKLIFSDTYVEADGSVSHLEAVFRYKDTFYVCFSRKKTEGVYFIRMVYTPKDYESVKLYIKGLKDFKWK